MADRPDRPGVDGGTNPAAILESLLDESGTGVAIVTLDGRTVVVNARAAALLPESWPPSPTAGLDRLRSVLDQGPVDLLDRPDGGAWRGEMLLAPGDEAPRPHDVVIVVRRTGTDETGFVGVVCHDLTDDRRRIDELVDRLDHDPVTGLLHRQAVIRRAADILARSDGTRRRTAALVIDVDHMRDTNQTLGHDVGDQILSATARRLERSVEPGSIVGRLGGDEFVVICFGVGGEPDVVALADHLRRNLSGRLVDRATELELSVSIGISLTTGEVAGSTSEAERRANRLVAEADTAVQAAKRSGRARVTVFTDELHRQAAARTELSAALVRGLRDGELDLEYQPIFSAVSEHGEGAEALVRWNHPTRGRLDAGAFIAVAERTGVIVPLGEWVLDQACGALRRWLDDERVDRRFAVHVNVSRTQLASPGFADRVAEIVEGHDLRPRQVVLEARETMLIDGEDDPAIRTMRTLRDLGVRIAIDNFGTGSQALSLLTDVGADVLKLDGSLALPSGASDADTRVVRSLVMLAHALDMQVVAERVTSVEQLRRLRAAGCDLVQGHLLGRPGPADELTTRTAV